MWAEIVPLTTAELGQLIDGLRQGTISPEGGPLAIRYAGLERRGTMLAAWLPGALKRFGSTDSLVAALQLVQADRRRAEREASQPEVIVTGPSVAHDSHRDTRVVVRELLESARRSVLIVSYAFFGSPEIFEPLARRMGENSSLQTRMILNVHPIRGQAISTTIQNFAHDFRRGIWPFHPRPQIYHLPESASHAAADRVSVHAKVLIVDEELVYLGSANFTTAALNRNIEVGVRFRNRALARELTAYFDRLIEGNTLNRLDLESAGDGDD